MHYNFEIFATPDPTLLRTCVSNEISGPRLRTKRTRDRRIEPWQSNRDSRRP